MKTKLDNQKVGIALMFSMAGHLVLLAISGVAAVAIYWMTLIIFMSIADLVYRHLYGKGLMEK